MKRYIPEIVSFILLITGIVLRTCQVPPFSHELTTIVFFFIAFLPVGVPVLQEAWKCIHKKDVFNEFTLMLLASIGAFYIGEYPEGVAVMLFYSIGEKLQEGAVCKARKHIKALLDVRPETARVIQKGTTICVSPENVKINDIIEVRAGERIPLDGILLSPHAMLDTAALTGESMPRYMGKGDEVLAGMIVSDCLIRIQVSRPSSESMLARILTLVEEASERKAPAELFIRKFARIYTPIVTGLAILVVFLPFIYSLFVNDFTYHFNEWLYRGLVFLVISCPCALVVSIPLSYYGGIGAASRKGILFKGGNYLDMITSIDTLVFDKTGTLTQGKFEVSELHAEHLTKKELLTLIASAEQHSNHPIAQAIILHALNQGVSLQPFYHEEELSGLGIKATSSDGTIYLVGNSRLFKTNNINYPSTLDNIEETIILCAIDGRYEGYLKLTDMLKEDSLQAIQSIRSLHINNIQILSGDKQGIVSKFAARLGIQKAYGNLMPDDKAEHIHQLKQAGHCIAFVGDGMNDAPVLALSDVGIAMGGLGSQAAIETADIIIQTDQPSKVATAIRLGRATRCIVHQNIVLSLGVKIIVLVLGALGIANLWAAVFADVGVAMLAICNALRIQTK